MPKRENSNGLLSMNDDSDIRAIISEIQPWGGVNKETRKQGNRETGESYNSRAQIQSWNPAQTRLTRMNASSPPDFYMSSTESSALRPVRKCYSLKRFSAAGRDDYLLVRIFPPIAADEFPQIDEEISELAVAAHLKGISLFPINKWPVDVYVLQVLATNPEKRDKLAEEELRLLAWAELYPTEEAALRTANRD